MIDKLRSAGLGFYKSDTQQKLGMLNCHEQNTVTVTEHCYREYSSTRGGVQSD